MRAEEGGVVGHLRGELAQALLTRDGQRVSRLDLRVGDPGSELLGRPGRGELAQLVVARGERRGDGGADPARLVRRAGHPRGELLAAVAGEHEVRVAVHEAGDHAAPACVDPLVTRRAGSLDRAYGPFSITTAASRTIPSGPSPSDGSHVASRPMLSSASVLTSRRRAIAPQLGGHVERDVSAVADDLAAADDDVCDVGRARRRTRLRRARRAGSFLPGARRRGRP